MGQTQTAELLSLADQLEKSLRTKIKISEDHYKICVQAILAMRNAAPNIKKVSGERLILKTYFIDEVLPYTTRLGGESEREYRVGDNTYLVKMHSARYKMFVDNIACVRCGIVGTHFNLERMTDGVSHRAHFNLYGIHPHTGEEVLMTKDHILPRSKGGKDNLSNYQTMCAICNGEKGNDLERNMEVHIQKFTDWISSNEKWVVTIDKVAGVIKPDIIPHKYSGRIIDIKMKRELLWIKQPNGTVCCDKKIPQYVLRAIQNINL